MTVRDSLSDKFSALADPTRRALLSRLAIAETGLTELAKPFEMSIPAVAKHLGVLQRAGLISREPRGVAKLEPVALAELTEWITICGRHWNESFDRLADYLNERAHE